MSTPGVSFGSTLAQGIQDAASIVALLGTDMCDTNAGLALSKGYMFPAACSVSMFGILGLAKYLIKSFIPLKIAKNVRIDYSKFDKRIVNEKLIQELKGFKKVYLNRLLAQGVKMRLEVVGYVIKWWFFSFISCVAMSCLNFIPYISHYIHMSDWTDVQYPLLLVVSSMIGSYTCCIDCALILSGSLEVYYIGENYRAFFEPHHPGNIYIRWVVCISSVLSATGITIGYIGSYLVVQEMSPIDMYL